MRLAAADTNNAAPYFDALQDLAGGGTTVGNSPSGGIGNGNPPKTAPILIPFWAGNAATAPFSPDNGSFRVALFDDTNPGLTSGNGSQGQTFVGPFTVNSRAHLANYSSGTVDLDINGNGLFDPQTADEYLFNLIHPFKNQPLGGADAMYQFGNQFSLPLLGIWDPPADGAPAGNPTGTTPTSGTATWITNLYTQILDRPPSASDLAYWVSQVNQGEAPGQVAQMFVTSNEYRAGQINQLYERYLGREADAAGLAYWTGVWNSTGGPELVLAGIISSPEYLATAQKLHPGLSANAAWVTALYQNLLNRAAVTSDVNFWVNNIETSGLASVVLGFVSSDEYHLDLINSEFETYLGRALDQPSAQAILKSKCLV